MEHSAYIMEGGVHVTDQAGPRRYECNQCNVGTILPIEVTQFWRPKSGFGARVRLVKPNKNKFISM